MPDLIDSEFWKLEIVGKTTAILKSWIFFFNNLIVILIEREIQLIVLFNKEDQTIIGCVNIGLEKIKQRKTKCRGQSVI